MYTFSFKLSKKPILLNSLRSFSNKFTSYQQESAIILLQKKNDDQSEALKHFIYIQEAEKEVINLVKLIFLLLLLLLRCHQNINLSFHFSSILK